MRISDWSSDVCSSDLELVTRQLLHGLGYRFRIQFGEVPGRPDIAFPARRRCVQVHAASGMPTAAACPGHHPHAPSSGTRSSRWEERRVRKEGARKGQNRWDRVNYKKKKEKEK